MKSSVIRRLHSFLGDFITPLYTFMNNTRKQVIQIHELPTPDKHFFFFQDFP